jgi:hypothetical protein
MRNLAQELAGVAIPSTIERSPDTEPDAVEDEVAVSEKPASQKPVVSVRDSGLKKIRVAARSATAY